MPVTLCGRSTTLRIATLLLLAGTAAACSSSEDGSSADPAAANAPGTTPGGSSGGTASSPAATAAPGAVDPACLTGGYARLPNAVTAVFAREGGAVVVAGTRRVEIDGAGKTGVEGTGTSSSQYWDLRLLPNGGLLSLDENELTTWDAAGKATASALVGKLLVKPSYVAPIEGGFLVAGAEKAAAAQNKRVIALQKLSTTGEADPTFGDKGIARVVSTDDLRLEGIHVAKSGEVWIRGSGKMYVPFLAKFSANGAADAAFGTAGVASLDRLGTRASRDLVFGKDGSVFLLGMTGDAPQIMKLRADGAPDATFGQGGLAELRVTKPLSSKYDEQVESKSLLLQEDGKLLVVSSYEWDDGEDRKLEEESLLVLRLGTDGALDASFGTEGRVRVALGAAGTPSKDWAKPGAAIVGSRLLVGGTTYTELGSKGAQAGGLVCLAL